MSTSYFIKLKNKKITEENARTIANVFIEIWRENQVLAIQLVTQLINKYKNLSCLLLLILQILDEDLIKWKINSKCIGLYEFIVTVLVNQFITEWFDYYTCNQSILVKQFITERFNYNIESYQDIDFDIDSVPFLIWYLESVSADKEYGWDQPYAFYSFKNDFCEELKKKLEEDPILQTTVDIFKNSEDSLVYNMSLYIEVRKILFSNNHIPYVTNDNLSRIQYDPNSMVHNLLTLKWFYKMFECSKKQQSSSQNKKRCNKRCNEKSSIFNSLPPEIIENVLKNWV